MEDIYHEPPFLCYLINILLIFSFYGLTYSADTPTPGANAVTEVVSGRNQNTRVWQIQKVVDDVDVTTMAMSQVTVTRFITEKADGLCYQDTANNWQVSVESIQSTSNITYPYQALQGPYQIKFGTGLDTQWPICYTVNGKIMQLGLRYLAFYDKGNNTLQPLGSINAVPPTLQGNTLTYTNIFPGVDLAYRYGKGSFEQNLVVRSLQSLPSPSQYQIDPATAYLVSVTEIDTATFACSIQDYTGQTLQFGYLSGEGTDIYFADGSTGQALCHFAQSPAFDSSPVKQSIPMYKFLYQQNGHTYLVEGIPYSFLISASLPVTLDYNIKTGTQSDNEVWQSGNTYYLSGTWTVPNGDTLMIEGGTVCKFSTGAYINVASGGQILAQGSTFNYVLFTSWKDTTMGDPVSTTGSPAAGDYYSAINLNYGASANSLIQYCKIAYAQYGLYIQTPLNNPIQNNILRVNSLDNIYFSGGSFGAASTQVVIFNNLFLGNAIYGIFGASSGYPCVQVLNNTFDSLGTGIYSQYDPVFVMCKNNLFSNCTTGMSGGGENSFGSHNYNSFYNVPTPVYAFGLASNEYILSSSPYISSPNGNYYLNQSNTTTLINAGDSTASVYGLNTKTTVAPVQAPNTITVSTTWSQVPHDTGMVDIGYHYDPVDVVVGNTGTYSALTIGTSSGVDSATLTILPGVVVSFWRNDSNSTTQQIFSWAYPNIIAHGHANNRIEFTSIYATGSLHTHPLGADGLYSYNFGIHLGQNRGPNSIIQNCIFRYAKAGIDLDPGTVLYHRINDNIFYDCRDGIAAVDSYVRAENNLFLAGNNNQYQVLVWSASYSSNSAIIRNNTMVGNGSGWYGINAITTNGNLTCYVDIRNNIFYGFATGVNLQPPYFVGVVSHNSLYNNSAIDYAGGLTNTNPVYSNPQFANSGSGSFDGYYLASTTGNVSRLPFTNYALTGINQGTIPTKAGSSIIVYASTGANTGVQLGKLSAGTYTSGSTSQGNILVQLLNSSGAVWSLNTSEYCTLYCLSGVTMNVYVPTLSITTPNSLYLWVAMDGSSYYADTVHGVTLYPNNPTQDAWYAMSYNTAGLAQASFSHLGTSPLVQAGDTTVRAYGSTATNQTLDSGTVNIGYHYLNRGFIQVAENQRQFEYEDGTPFVANGSSLGFASFEYQDANSLPTLGSYLALIRSYGVTAITQTLHQNRATPYQYTDNIASAWCIEQPVGTYHDETAQWWDNYLNLLDKNNLKLGWLVWQDYVGYSGDSIHPRDHYNPFFSGSTIFHGYAGSILDVFQASSTLDYETSLMTYCVNRWGDRESILYWDPIIETDYVVDEQDLSTDALNSWINTLHGFIKNYEVQKWGHSHMVSASSGRPFASFTTPSSGIVYTCSTTTSANDMALYPRLGARLFGGENSLGVTTTISCVTESIQTCLFTNPILDMYNVHYGGYLQLTFPAVDAITAQAPNGLWYPVLGKQWLIDSVATDMVLQTHYIVTCGFSLMTAGKKPYFAGLYYPGFWEVPWTANTAWYTLDPPSTYDPGTSIYAPDSAIIRIDRHIDPTFKQAYHHYNGWALTASGAAGAGFGGGVPDINFYNTDTNGTFTLNGNHVFYQLGTTEYRNSSKVNTLIFRNGIEYNPFNYSILTDYLAYYMIQTTVNWNEPSWENLDSTNRISLSGSTDVFVFYSGDSSNMLVYFLRDMLNAHGYDTGNTSYYSSNSVTTMSVTFSGFPNNTLIGLTWFDPESGNSLGASSFSGGSITVTAPGFNREIVAVLKPE